MTTLQAALAYLSCGLSVIPIAADGSKSPLVAWTPYQTAPMTPDEAERLFPAGVGLAVIGGVVSGGLEVLDFDHPDIYPRWLELLEQTDPELAAVVADLPLVATPAGGRHLYYRCSTVDGNAKLATAAERFRDCTGKLKRTLIETRGERGYVLAPPSPAACHDAAVPYLHVGGVEPANVPTITPAERQTLLQLARAFDEVPPEPRPEHRQPVLASAGAGRPGDDWAAVTSWAEVLTPHGWALISERSGTAYWRRPGKTKGISATVGGAQEWLYVFTTNAPPLDSGRSYTKFAAYTALEHGDDFRAATRGLAADGYGEQRAGQPRPEPDEDTPEACADDDCEVPDEDTGEDPWEDDPNYYTGPLADPDDKRTTGPLPDVILYGPEIAAPLPPIDYLIEELGLVAGGGAPHMIAGYGFSGKTMACQSMLLSLAAARPVWGQYRCREVHRVAHVDLEQGNRLTRERYQLLALGMGVHIPRLGETLALTTMPPDLRLTRACSERWMRLMDGRSLIVIDSLKAGAGGTDENSSDMRQHLDLLGDLAERTGCRALLIHHARKPSEDSASGGRYSIRGSSAIYDGSDCMFVFSGEKGEPVSVEHVKSRTTGQLAPDVALVIEQVPAAEDAEDQTTGLRVAVRGAELITEQRQVAAEARRQEQAHRDAERIRAALRAHPLGLNTTDLKSAAGLSGARCSAAVLIMGDEVTKSGGANRGVLHQLSGGAS